MKLDVAALGGRLRRRIRPAPRPNPADGCVEELSTGHVAGWIRNAADPSRRVPYEVVCTQTGQVLAAGVADQYRHHLHGHGFGDRASGFHTRLPAARRSASGIGVRVLGSTRLLPLSAQLRTSFEPILHVAMDIVDNCNLRCPFCLYDYSATHTTHLMTRETLQAAIRFVPYTRDGQFWFSCLHEPALHPELMAFVDLVPREFRRKLFYTTNLAKRMPDTYFDWLALSGMHNINVSIESRNPATYERMRKGARWRIFAENWEKLLAAFARASSPPRIRYIAMAYKSNLDELPELSRYLIEERQASQVELRYTFDLPYIPSDFRAAEFLDATDWVRLRKALPPYGIDRLLLIEPPGAIPPPPAAALPVKLETLQDYYMLRLSWDGTLRVEGISRHSRHEAVQQHVLATRLDTIADAGAFIETLNQRQAALL